MSEREIVEERLAEKAKMDKANKLITRLFIITSSLIFVTFLLVWLIQRLPELTMPAIYGAATGVIMVSSFLIVLAQFYIQADNIERAFRYTGLGLLVGMAFLILQVMGWRDMLAENVTFRNILFPFSLIHFFHVLVGILLLTSVFRRVREYRVHSKSRQYAYNVFLFWHFLGVVWLIFFFLS